MYNNRFYLVDSSILNKRLLNEFKHTRKKL